jgi:hypothetical protein
MSSEKDILFKKLDYLNSEYLYKKNLLKRIDIDFNSKINEIIDSHKELKDIADINTPELNSEDIIEIDYEDNNIIENNHLKDMYRQITKMTHPDKIKNNYLNGVYVETNKCYDEGDEIGLYNSAYKIGIDFDINQKLESDIIKRIDQILNNIRLLENSYPWKWFHSNPIDKDKVILDFIEKTIVS